MRRWRSARANIAAWSREIDGEGLDAIVINTSGCGTTVKDYGFMFRTEPEPWRGKAERIAALACDITRIADAHRLRADAGGARTDGRLSFRLQPAARPADHDEPKALLRRAGFRVVEPAEPHICCGSAGTYNMLQPEIASRLRERKLGNLRATEAGPGRRRQYRLHHAVVAAAALPVVHTVELLDWMAGGPRAEGPAMKHADGVMPSCWRCCAPARCRRSRRMRRPGQ